MNGPLQRWRASSCQPYPEVVEPRRHKHPFEILDSNHRDDLPSNGMADLVRRKMYVPMSRAGRMVSMHELAHVRWSPKKLPESDCNPHIVLAIEDARINLGLAAAGFAIRVSAKDAAKVVSLAAADLDRGDLAAFVLRSLATLGTNMRDVIAVAAEDENRERSALARRLVHQVHRSLDRIRGDAPVAPFDAVVPIAREVERELRAYGLLDDMRAPAEVCCTLHGTIEEAPEESSDGSEIGLPAAKARLRQLGRVEPGTMTITHAELTQPVRTTTRGRGRRWIASTEGSLVRQVHRWSLDGAIFRRPVRQRGGTVLVDVSGSMSFESEALERIVGEVPAARIALYSGSRDAGELRIVVDRGRRAACSDLALPGRGNIVDVPALEWLARQPQPRVWISDGGVTGIGDRASGTLRKRCGEIARGARIERCGDVDAAVVHLRG